jgi:asparagine synthase (glutamine-hydrolysing)
VTIFAGAFARRPRRSIDDDLCRTLRRLTARGGEEGLIEHRSSELYLVKRDIGAFADDPAWVDRHDGIVGTLVGDPLLGPAHSSRADQLQVLARAIESADDAALRSAVGVFASVIYTPRRGLHLLTDKLGVRPVYYAADDDRIVFATQLRVMEEICRPLKLDLRGAIESMSFGFPLARRTPYHDISRLYAADHLVANEKAIEIRPYYDWKSVPVEPRPLAESVRELAETFAGAISRRNRRDTITSAYLSGGLDSRCVVAGLRQRGSTVYTFGFSPPGSFDEAYAAKFAASVGTHHTEFNQGTLEPQHSWAALLRAAQEKMTWPAGMPQRPQVAWSGDGGSVGLGHVYMHAPIAEPLAQSNVEEGLRRYLKTYGIGTPKAIVARAFRRRVEEVPLRGVLDEMRENDCGDPVRSFHFVLMFNDQRHHLDVHFEQIDLQQREFLLPFYDSRFLEAIFKVPMEDRLYHRLYHAWLETLPGGTSTPWQTYPGHEPCPLPADEGATAQWHLKPSEAWAESYRREMLRLGDELGAAADFPSPVLSLVRFRVAMAAYRMRLRDYYYLVTSTEKLHRFWQQCRGEFVFD